MEDQNLRRLSPENVTEPTLYMLGINDNSNSRCNVTLLPNMSSHIDLLKAESIPLILNIMHPWLSQHSRSLNKLTPPQEIHLTDARTDNACILPMYIGVFLSFQINKNYPINSNPEFLELSSS